MKPMTKIAPMLTNFTSQKASLLPSSKKGAHSKSKGRKSALSVIGLIGCLVLSGCTGSTYSSHFDCPMGEGAGCASISRVNKLIDRREIDYGNDDAPLAKAGVSNPVESRLPSLGNQVYVYYGPDQLSRLIPAEELKFLTARESIFDRGSTLDQEGN